MSRAAFFAACVLGAFGVACREGGEPRRAELVVYAAASLREVLGAEEARLEREVGVDLVFNFGASGDLARQIAAAGKADVFFSAGEIEMDDLQRAGLVLLDTRAEDVSNRLVVIEPEVGSGAFAGPFSPSALSDARIRRWSLADTNTVPAGRYAKAWLEGLGAWPGIASRVLPAVDARAALAAVEAGAADAGIVYGTDALRSARVRVVYSVPLAEGPRIVYPLAALAHGPHEAEARALVAALRAPQSRAAFVRCGFVVAPAGDAR